MKGILSGATGAPGVWPQRIGGVTRGARALVLAALLERDGTMVACVETEDELDDLEGDLHSLAGIEPARFPSLAEDGDQVQVLSERLWVLARIAAGDAPRILIATLAALLEPVPPLEVLRAGVVTLAAGQRVDLETLAGQLLDAGLARRARAEVAGEFSLRGGILDVYPYAEEHPLRIELFDDAIESMRRFETESQRSLERLDEVTLNLVDAAALREPGDDGRLLLELAMDAGGSPGRVWFEPGALVRRVERLAGRPHPGRAGMRSAPEALAALRSAPGAHADVGLLAGESGIDLGSVSTQRFRGSLEASFQALAARAAGGERVSVYCRNAAEVERFGELLSATSMAPEARAQIELHEGLLSEGFQLPDSGVTLLSGDALIGRSRPLQRRHRRFRRARPLASHLDLRPGDFVVHVSHGIARFIDLEIVEKAGRRMEHLVLEFAGETRLLVSVANADLVHRYVGSGDAPPPLSKLGGTRWAARRSRVAREVMEMAVDLLRLQAVRERSSGIAHTPPGHYQMEFEAAFPYEETPDQLSCMKVIHDDLGRSQPMDRLLCGDVGYGKTELAMRAAFRAVLDGYQVAVLVPTTVLAAQHQRTFRERMAAFPVRVEMLSRFQTSRQQKKVLDDLAVGGVDIVVGTHRLLSADVSIANLGLVVIDEEQRFGVASKEHLKRMRTEVNVLTMTATPIPRTLHMAMLGIRDISTLATPPRERTPVATRVVEWSDRLVQEAIQEELARDGQVYVVHNRVQDIQELALRIMKMVPDARVGIGHGQLPEKLLAKTMTMFVEGELDVLVCTTIIENGLDIPNANTMVIDGADHYGLAELHQLRGRIGRYDRRAYCYLMVPRDRALTEIGMKRLKAIEEFAQLGAGFDIAMRDLEIRGTGNIVGSQQSGHIAAVGYELYCRLLRAASENLRHVEGGGLPPEVPVDLGVDCSIGEEYVPDARERLLLYTRLSSATTAELEERLRAELLDRFGPVPEPAEALLVTARAKAVLARLGVTQVTADVQERCHRLILKTVPGRSGEIAASLAGTRDFVRDTTERKVMIDLVPFPDSTSAVLSALRRLLRLDEIRSSLPSGETGEGAKLE